MKKVVIVTNSVTGGGAENSMLKLHKEFLHENMNSTLLALNADGLDWSSDSNIIELGRKWKAGSGETLDALRNFRRVIRSKNPEAIILNCELPELYGALSKFSASKLFVVEHTSRPWYQRRAMGVAVRLILKWRSVTWVTVNSQDQTIWPFRQQGRFIPNPINLPISNRSHKTLESLVFVGRLRPEKRAIWAIELAAELNLPLDVYGAGSELENLKRESELLGARVIFHGYDQDVWTKIESGQLVVVPSEFEGDGIVVLEAIATDCPIILADNEDLRRFNLADANYGASAKEMAMKIKDNPLEKFQVSREVRSKLLKNRSIERVAQEWVNLIN